MAGAVGFSVALKLAQLDSKTGSYAMKHLQDRFIDEISRLLANALINGSKSHRLPSNVHITLPGTDNERLLFQLDELGILAASGSACSASEQEPSHVLRALGHNADYARSSLRFSMGRDTTLSDLHRTVKVLKDLAG